jgi:hypothetical protein
MATAPTRVELMLGCTNKLHLHSRLESKQILTDARNKWPLPSVNFIFFIRADIFLKRPNEPLHHSTSRWLREN